MISDLLKVFDSILNLTKDSKNTKRKLFEDHIQPIFLDLTTIHNDYTESFEKILEEYRHLPHSKELMTEVVSKKKAELEFLRVKAFEISKIYTEENLRELPEVASDFFLAVSKYLTSASGQFKTYHGHYSELLEFIKETEFQLPENYPYKYPSFSMLYKHRTESGQLVGDDLGYKMYIVNENVKQRWTELTSAYARARIKLMV